MKELTLKNFYFIRHGETDWNLNGLGMGQKDIPLNDTGLAQAATAAELLKSKPIDLICHSPLQRAKVTAQIISKKLNCPLLSIPELAECCWGVMEGQGKGEWTTNWKNGIPIEGAEIYTEFRLRALDGINTALSQPGTILIVSHGGVFWAVQHFAKLGTDFYIKNCVSVLLTAPADPDLPWTSQVIES